MRARSAVGRACLRIDDVLRCAIHAKNAYDLAGAAGRAESLHQSLREIRGRQLEWCGRVELDQTGDSQARLTDFLVRFFANSRSYGVCPPRAPCGR